MITIQNNLPETSRVWVYQANRAFTSSELNELKETLVAFNNNWEAHGKKLNSAIEVYYDQFIVIFVDETPQEATGCSIDKSVALVKSIEQKFGIDLLDRMNLTYKEGEEVKNIKMADFQTQAREGVFSGETIVFNNLVTNKAEFVEKWETKAANSWHANLV